MLSVRMLNIPAQLGQLPYSKGEVPDKWWPNGCSESISTEVSKILGRKLSVPQRPQKRTYVSVNIIKVKLNERIWKVTSFNCEIWGCPERILSPCQTCWWQLKSHEHFSAPLSSQLTSRKDMEGRKRKQKSTHTLTTSGIQNHLISLDCSTWFRRIIKWLNDIRFWLTEWLNDKFYGSNILLYTDFRNVGYAAPHVSGANCSCFFDIH